MVNKALKIDKIINAWLEYIRLDDYSNAGVEVNGYLKKNCLKLNGISINYNHVFIKKEIFLELYNKVNEEKKSQDDVWGLSFPQIHTRENGKLFLRPLFILDIKSLLLGEYQEKGWNLDGLELVVVEDNLAKFINLDDEQRDQLNANDGLRNFLISNFEVDSETSYENWMKSVRQHRSYKIKEIQPQPYLFKWKGNNISGKLRKDLEEIKRQPRNQWFKSGHPAYEYLFGKPQLPKPDRIYMGAFLTHTPTDSQLEAIKHAQTEPITAVQGPPGSGKTTLILHLIAQQVVKRALYLIETGEDINNLTVVSSTNNKAVDNVIERLDQELLENQLFYLKGGKRDNINNSAKPQLEKALDYLDNNDFEENIFHTLKQQIKGIQNRLLAEEANYLEQRQQRLSDEVQKPILENKIQELEHNLERDQAAQTNFERKAEDLAEYEKLPIEAYKVIKFHFQNAKRQLPEKTSRWWIRLWRWIWRKTDECIITSEVLACKSEIKSTFNTPFAIENPMNRRDLKQQLRLVTERLEKANELKTIQKNLQELSEKIKITEQDQNQASDELNKIEARLEKELHNFYASFHQTFHNQQKELFQLSHEFLMQHALREKDKIKQTLELYKSLLSELGRSKDKIEENLAENLDKHIKNLSLLFPVITTSLHSIRNMLPWISEYIDRAIVDEAGMIPQHQTFPLLVRSRQAIIVGDPLQIEPIITLGDERRKDYYQKAFLDKGLTENDYHRYSPEQEYRATSYHRAAGASGESHDIGQGILLREHYRCQRSIIEYCQKIAKYDLQVKTEPRYESKLGQNLIAYHVEGNIIDNVNEQEVNAVCELVQHLVNQGYSTGDIGVISPFRVHADALKNRLVQKFPKLNKDSVGTIHTFQGSEKKVIILSTRVCRPKDNVNWINRRPNLLNVAVSRAKELFILVGNLYRLEKGGSYTRQLVEHIREHGVILEYKTEAEIHKKQPGATMIYDCDHVEVFRKALEQTEQELMIVTPWIRGIEAKQFINDIVTALEKGVKVTVMYGNKGDEENDNNDPEAEKNLKELFSQYSGSRLIRLGQDIYVESRGTNEKILVCDSQFAVVGSWNWLSHPYRKQCSRSLINPKVQIRRETSIQHSESLEIENIKARISQLI